MKGHPNLRRARSGDHVVTIFDTRVFVPRSMGTQLLARPAVNPDPKQPVEKCID